VPRLAEIGGQGAADRAFPTRNSGAHTSFSLRGTAILIPCDLIENRFVLVFEAAPFLSIGVPSKTPLRDREGCGVFRPS